VAALSNGFRGSMSASHYTAISMSVTVVYINGYLYVLNVVPIDHL
jgi:hypothetical protein